MFAFAIWDVRRREVFLARDRVGKKPLYYASTSERFWFASEPKSILQDPTVGMEVDPQAIDAYMTFSYVPAPMTGFTRIHKLPGGHYLRVTADHIDEREYWDWDFQETSSTTSATPVASDLDGLVETPLVEKLRDLLKEAVQVRLMSEVPLGAFLSGGVDSSSIVALMTQLMSHRVRTTSIGFDYQRFNELAYAQQIANEFGTDHVAHTVKADTIGVLEKIAWHLDEPFGDPSVVPTYYLSQHTRRRVTVALSGDGGDEVFGGYDFRYVPTQAEVRLRRKLFDPVCRPIFSALAAIYPRGSWLPRSIRLKTIFRNLSVSTEMAHAHDISFVATDLRKRLYRPEFTVQLGGFSPEDLVLSLFRKTHARHWLDRALYVDAKFYMQNDVLTKVDRMSMANSLEVRSPLLDQKIMDFMASVPASLKLKGNRGKHILKEAMKSQLPSGIINRPKQGFSIPVGEWLRSGCRDYVADWLFAQNAFIYTYLRPSFVQKLWTAHQRGADYSSELWTLLMLELWGTSYRHSVRGEAVPPIASSRPGARTHHKRSPRP